MSGAHRRPGLLRSRAKQGLTQLAKLARVRVTESVPFPALTDEERESVQSFFSRPKFFIIGYPRSGTTLLARLVRVHPRVHCNWQAHFFTQEGSLVSALGTQEVAAWVGRQNNRWLGSGRGMGVILRATMDYVMEAEAARLKKDIVGDKSPAVDWSRQLQSLVTLYPDARILNIVRDGRDVALSRRIQQFIDQPEHLDRRGREILRRFEASAEERASSPSMFSPDWLAAEAALWDREVRDTDAEARQHFGDRYLAVRFETLLERPEDTMQDIWRFLQAGRAPRGAGRDISNTIGENPAADWHQQVAPKVVAGLPRGTAGGWRQVMTDSEVRLFRQHASAGLAHWGYPLE